MGVDEGNIGKLSNNYSYGTCLQVKVMVHVQIMKTCIIRLAKSGSINLCYRFFTVLSIIRSMFVCNSHYILHL